MATIRQIIDKVLDEMFDQVPTMTVQSITLDPPDPQAGEDVTARIEVGGGRHVLCELRTASDSQDARLHSARVIES